MIKYTTMVKRNKLVIMIVDIEIKITFLMNDFSDDSLVSSNFFLLLKKIDESNKKTHIFPDLNTLLNLSMSLKRLEAEIDAFGMFLKFNQQEIECENLEERCLLLATISEELRKRNETFFLELCEATKE